MPRSFLVRTGFCRGHTVAAESATVGGEITSDATELKPVEHPGVSWATFRDNLPIDFTIRSDDEEKNNSPRFAISINGVYFEILKIFFIAKLIH